LKLSDDTLKVLDFLDNYSEGGIRKRNDIALLLEIAASFNLYELFNNIVFTGKSVWNLSKKMKKIDPNQEGADLVRKEFARQLEELKKYLYYFFIYYDFFECVCISLRIAKSWERSVKFFTAPWVITK